MYFVFRILLKLMSIFIFTDKKEAEETSLYRVHVITGDVIGAGTDADVFIVFIGSNRESGKSVFRILFVVVLFVVCCGCGSYCFSTENESVK